MTYFYCINSFQRTRFYEGNRIKKRLMNNKNVQNLVNFWPSKRTNFNSNIWTSNKRSVIKLEKNILNCWRKKEVHNLKKCRFASWIIIFFFGREITMHSKHYNFIVCVTAIKSTVRTAYVYAMKSNPTSNNEQWNRITTFVNCGVVLWLILYMYVLLKQPEIFH